jgi:hypothetical protein
MSQDAATERGMKKHDWRFTREKWCWVCVRCGKEKFPYNKNVGECVRTPNVAGEPPPNDTKATV